MRGTLAHIHAFLLVRSILKQALNAAAVTETTTVAAAAAAAIDNLIRFSTGDSHDK